MRVRVLFENRPLPGARVTALHRSQPDAPADHTLAATTDRAGRASFPPFDVDGPWLVRLVHLRPVSASVLTPSPSPAPLSPPGGSEELVGWESFWATYTFGVRLLPPALPPLTPAGSPAPRRGD